MNEFPETTVRQSWGTRQFVEAMFRHKKKVAATSLISLALGILALCYFPRKYRSEAKVYLQLGRESVGIDPTATTGQTISLQQSGRDDEVKSAIDVARSRGVIAEVVDRMGADAVLGKTELGAATPNPVAQFISGVVGTAVSAIRSIDPVETEEKAAIQIERNLEIDAQRSSTVIVLTYDAKTPELAQSVLENLVDVYLEEHMRVHRNEKSREFFDGQLQVLRDRLEVATEQLRDAKSELGLASTEGRAASLEQQLREIRLEQYRTSQSLATSRAHIQEVDQQLVDTPQRLIASKKQVPNQGADLLRDQLYALQVRKIELEARYSGTHPLVQAINDQVNEAQEIVDGQSAQREETIDDVNPIYRELALDRKKQLATAAGLEARAEKLQRQELALLSELRELNAAEVRLAQLSRDVDLASNNFLQYAENLEEARIDKELEKSRISNISALQTATLARKPVSPSKLMILVATLLMSTAAPVALALGLESASDRLRREAELEDTLEIPVIAVVPEKSLHGRLLPAIGGVPA